VSDLSFFWHDYETFGRQPRRDRPAQFAGLRTDANLQEIDAPLMFHCQPAPDFLPDPESCLLTGILPQECLARGLPEVAFAEAIHEQLARPGTVGVGYNSIRFDDEVTRHLFWRNLIDPYAREWQNACGRWDLLDVLRCCHALRPEGIEWPRQPDGRTSFKLELLTAANGLQHEAAHDALSDVRATVALARRVRECQPRLFDFCLRLRQKSEVLAEIESAQRQGRPFLHISGMYGVERGCLALVWPLAPHPRNKNEIIVWDLAHDPAELFTLDAAAIRERLFTRSEDLPEGVARLPIKTIHLNRAPIVIGNLKTLGPEPCSMPKPLPGAVPAWAGCGMRCLPARPRQPRWMWTRTSTAASSARPTAVRWSDCAPCRPKRWPNATRPSRTAGWTNCCFASAPATTPRPWETTSALAGSSTVPTVCTAVPAAR
jgi:exodeoxyribonuclease-1